MPTQREGGIAFRNHGNFILIKGVSTEKGIHFECGGGDTNMLRHTGHYNLKVFIA